LYLPIGGYFLSDDFGMFRARARVELFRPPGREKGIPLSGAGDFFDAEKVTKKAFGGYPRMPPFFGRMLVWAGHNKMTFRQAFLPPRTIFRRCA